jgi:hypothetical protein
VTLLNLQMWWRLLITSWGVGYALYFIQALLDTMKASAIIPGWMLVITMKFEIASFLGLYFALSRSRTNQIGDAWTWTFVSFILFLLTCIEVLIEALATSGTYRGTVANAISCALLGVAISMFVGRLDSRRISIHPLVLFCCYAYAAIQPIYPLASKDFVLFLYAATLFFKVIMVAYVTYLVGNRIMLAYVEQNNSDPKPPPSSPYAGPAEPAIPPMPIGPSVTLAEKVPQKIIVQSNGPELFH